MHQANILISPQTQPIATIPIKKTTKQAQIIHTNLNIVHDLTIENKYMPSYIPKSPNENTNGEPKPPKHFTYANGIWHHTPLTNRSNNKNYFTQTI